MPDGIELLREIIQDRLQRVTEDLEYRPDDVMTPHWMGEKTSLAWMLEKMKELFPECPT